MISLGNPASSTTKTGRHYIAEILLKVALNTKNSNSNSFRIGGVMVSVLASSVNPMTLIF
jgi:hypothetical protein